MSGLRDLGRAAGHADPVPTVTVPDRLDEILAKYGDPDIIAAHDCCGCSKPWEIYDDLLAEIRALSEAAS